LDRTDNKTKLPQEIGREIKRVARLNEDPAIVGIPVIVGVTVVGIEPTIIVIVFNVEHIEITVRVGLLCIVLSKPPHPENFINPSVEYYS
jgi:hypothetical protein